MEEPWIKHPMKRFESGMMTSGTDLLAVESPLEIKVVTEKDTSNPSPKTLATTMRTPGDDRNLVAGFLFSEGVIHNRSDLIELNHVQNADRTINHHIMKCQLRSDFPLNLETTQRLQTINVSCGVCGKQDLEHTELFEMETYSTPDFKVIFDLLHTLPAKLRTGQPMFARTGGVHGVGLFNAAMEFIQICEDIGRHNALDKLIGSGFLNQNLPWSGYGLCFSGRLSYDLTYKALRAGCRFLVCIGAPSSLAIELAEKHKATVVGFLSENRLNFYCGQGN